jgi:hypothetical protein
MHVVLDRKKLIFLPIKHEDTFVVCNLVFLEAPNAHAYICPLDQNFLSKLTDLELMILYKNTTNEKAMNVGDSMRNILFEIAERIPAREVNAFELEQQAASVPKQTSKRYLYQPGAFVPFEKPDLFALDPVVLPKAEDEQLISRRPRTGPAGPATPAPGRVAPHTPAARPTPAARGPRQGNVRELIWAVADRIWEKANKPTDVKVVLNLRKEIMVTLESEHAVKKTTSSNELGNWMKARI